MMPHGAWRLSIFLFLLGRAARAPTPRVYTSTEAIVLEKEQPVRTLQMGLWDAADVFPLPLALRGPRQPTSPPSLLIMFPQLEHQRNCALPPPTHTHRWIKVQLLVILPVPAIPQYLSLATCVLSVVLRLIGGILFSRGIRTGSRSQAPWTV